MTEVFTTVGAITVLTIAFCLLFGVTTALIMAIKEWLHAKNEIVITTKKLTDMQVALMNANNRLNERVEALESEVRDD